MLLKCETAQMKNGGPWRSWSRTNLALVVDRVLNPKIIARLELSDTGPRFGGVDLESLFKSK